MIPCLEPVIMILDGVWEVTRGRSVEIPFMTPKRLTAIIFWKYWGSDQVPLRPMPAFRARRLILPVVVSVSE